jgi:predicted nucleic acid-binding protein
MKQTKDRVFLDSNILVYSYSYSEQEKQNIAQQLISDSNSFISTQVLQELCNIVTRKFKFSFSHAILAIQECCNNNNVHQNTESTITYACSIAERYNLSFYDSVIVAAAIESGCVTLYSEDLNNGQIIEGKITIRNPFSASVQR